MADRVAPAVPPQERDVPAPATETAAVGRLLDAYPLGPEAKARVRDRAVALTRGMRAARRRFGGIDEFLQEFGLTTKEGVALMCLAEALLRIPDAATADALIEDKIGGADWDRHLGHAESVFVNAATWGLMLTGRVVALDDPGKPSTLLRRLVARAGEPAIRLAMRQAVRILGRQFVMGETIEEALERARDPESVGYRHSFDMLGEGARTMVDADGYMSAYERAIDAIGGAMRGRGPLDGPGISVKLSALHPRYEEAQHRRALSELVPRVVALARRAATVNMALTIDAEEAERLDLSLDVIEAVLDDTALGGWQGFGLAVQAYQICAPAVVDRVIALARTRRRRLMVRLVKGAYWDSEIKKAQERGFAAYPVFTRKAGTDLSYIVCAARLLAARDVLYPCFATHNAHTVAAVMELAGREGGYEFQRLHGMGEPLYHQLVGRGSPDNVPCRVYAPVGGHRDLLAYLVRRLLENGANTSFVNRIVDEHVAAEDLVRDPAEVMARHASKPHPRILLPLDMFRPTRVNSGGLDLADRRVSDTLLASMRSAAAKTWRAAPLIAGTAAAGRARDVRDPANLDRVIGTVIDADAAAVDRAHRAAAAGSRDWARTPVEQRATALDRVADLIEAERVELMTLIAREAGRTIPDALSEVREAADFCRYYAAEARRLFAPAQLPGPTGERNTLTLHGRGAVACISPWNFPLAIFTGQVVAALVAGNTVLAKPAEQTPLIAARAVALLHRAGVPADVLHLLPGDGKVGAALCGDVRTAGVAFTGSVETAWTINQALAARRTAIAPLIAETGGQNAMLVDSSALPEQVVDDAITSAFRSAGQRCSALRVLFVQDDIADRIVDMIAGAARELVIGDPMDLATDVGPVIDADAKTALETHVARMAREARLVAETPMPKGLPQGHWFAPRAYEIDSLARLTGEVFGPVLHIVRYAAGRLDAVLDAIEATGFGLTLGVHSRIDRTVETIVNRLPVGNAYVNRNMIGAVVGVQPFGGEGLSGTGPKAGGPHYLTRFAIERTLSINTAAAGGNATLVSLGEA